MKDYSKPDPGLLERLKTASDTQLAAYLKNARAKLPETQWFVDAIVSEQVSRGGLRNMNASSVREIILRYARSGRTCTYKAIAEELGIEWNQAHRRLPSILREVCESELDHGRPFLTAIVVSQQGRCGDGFFELARRNGAVFTDKQRFQEEEQQRVFEFWGRATDVS